jgi:hypothetical protein
MRLVPDLVSLWTRDRAREKKAVLYGPMS